MRGDPRRGGAPEGRIVVWTNNRERARRSGQSGPKPSQAVVGSRNDLRVGIRVPGNGSEGSPRTKRYRLWEEPLFERSVATNPAAHGYRVGFWSLPRGDGEGPETGPDLGIESAPRPTEGWPSHGSGGMVARGPSTHPRTLSLLGRNLESGYLYWVAPRLLSSSDLPVSAYHNGRRNLRSAHPLRYLQSSPTTPLPLCLH